MVKVCFCSSKKFYDLVRKFAKELDNEGIKYFTPNLDFKGEDSDIEWSIKAKLTKDHFARIDNSDLVYVVNLNGYIGESVFGEIAYAKGAKKKVYALEPAETPTKSVFIDEVLTIDGLIKKVKQFS